VKTIDKKIKNLTELSSRQKLLRTRDQSHATNTLNREEQPIRSHPATKVLSDNRGGTQKQIDSLTDLSY